MSRTPGGFATGSENPILDGSTTVLYYPYIFKVISQEDRYVRKLGEMYYTVCKYWLVYAMLC